MKAIYLILSMLIFCCGFAQTTTGIIHYGEIQSLGMGRPVGFDYNAFLIFDAKTSLYVTRKDSLELKHIKGQHDIRNPKGGASYAVSTNTLGFQYYNDLETQKFKSRDIGFKYIDEETPKIDWQIQDETKKIGDLTCIKATTTFRGRNYTAWFTMVVPLPFGPWKLQGLPGLIVEAYDTDKEIYWYFKELNSSTDPKFLRKIKLPINKEWIDGNEFKEFLIKIRKRGIAAGRMAGENAGIEISPPPRSSSYIEIYDEMFEDNKK